MGDQVEEPIEILLITGEIHMFTDMDDPMNTHS